jgi:hypothetical protein
MEFAIFKGTSLDIYIHWLVLGLGIGILVSGILVVTTCRSYTLRFLLNKTSNNLIGNLYSLVQRFHSYYWVSLWMLLILHLMVTITHVGFPAEGVPYLGAHWFVFITAIVNLLMTFVVFSTCKSFISLIRIFVDIDPLHTKLYQKYYRLHPWLWLLWLISICIHIGSGIYHAVNT